MPLPASRRRMCAGQLGPQHKNTITGDARRVMAADEATLAFLVLHCAESAAVAHTLTDCTQILTYSSAYALQCVPCCKQPSAKIADQALHGSHQPAWCSHQPALLLAPPMHRQGRGQTALQRLCPALWLCKTLTKSLDISACITWHVHVCTC
jgi:hypothetical protein